MLTKGDFAKPPLDKIGAATAREVFVEVGYSISQWEHLETII